MLNVAAGVEPNAGTGVADLLRRHILTGKIEPGSRLTQRDLAAELGLSSMPIRDAIKILLNEGLVVHEGPKTIVVAPLRADDFIDIMEMRQHLEPQALRKSAPRLTPDDLQKCREILTAAQSDLEPYSHRSKHWDFHRCLYSRTSRPRLVAAIETLYLHLNRYLMPPWAQVGGGAHWAPREWELLEHVEKQRWDAADAHLRDDLERTMLKVLRAIP